MRCGGGLSVLREKLESITLYYTVSSYHTKSPPKECSEYHQELTVGASACGTLCRPHLAWAHAERSHTSYTYKLIRLGD